MKGVIRVLLVVGFSSTLLAQSGASASTLQGAWRIIEFGPAGPNAPTEKLLQPRRFTTYTLKLEGDTLALTALQNGAGIMASVVRLARLE